jgi:hypothetical protein
VARPHPDNGIFSTLLAKQAPRIDDAMWLLRHATSPLVALHAIADLRRSVIESEQILVNEARKEGHTWEAIAEALGESRQAVHRRHSRPSGA